MRLEICAQDRLGICQDILDILVSHSIDLRGIEVLDGLIYLNFPTIEFSEFQHLMPEIRRINGIEDVKTTPFMPYEREHFEFDTILKTLPDPVFSIDAKGKILVINDAATANVGMSEEKLKENPIGHWLKGFNFTKWLEAKTVEAQSARVEFHGQDFLADVFPIHVPDDGGKALFAGGVVVLKSESRFGEQITAFRKIDSDSFNGLVSLSSAMRKAVREAKKMAILDAPMLLIGETGTGKELLARACHKASHRTDMPFLVLNCASLPDSVAETELFGYGPNTLEASDKSKQGLFEQANGGTVFLDEVGEMSTQLQTKLLRFLQDGSFRRVGDDKEVHVDVRIICSTQKDLPGLVQERKFREDLYYRLNVLTLLVPPLRERKADVIPLAESFVKKVSQQLGRIPPRLSKTCQEYLTSYPWPGNVRQLENSIYRAVSLLEDNELSREHMQLPAFANDFGYMEKEFQGSLDDAVKRFEASLLRRLYPNYPSTRQLARKLGLSHTAIANKLREYGINKKTVKVL